MHVVDAMSTQVVWIGPDEPLAEAFELMKELEIRHLPVVENGRLIGMLFQSDILLHAVWNGQRGYVPPELRSRSVMMTQPVTCHPQNRLADAAATMITCKVDGLPVVGEHGELIGILTAVDLLNRLCQQEEATGGEVIPFDTRLRMPGEVGFSPSF